MSLTFLTGTLEHIVKGIVNTFDNKDPKAASAAAIRALANNDYKRVSIKARASKSVAYYPIIASGNVSFETTHVLAKYIERGIADMIKIIISNENIVNLDQEQTKSELIAQFQGQTIGLGGEAEIDQNGDVHFHHNGQDNPVEDVFNRYTDRELRRSTGPRSSASTKNEAAQIIATIRNEWGEISEQALIPFGAGLKGESLQEQSSKLVARISREISQSPLVESVEILSEAKGGKNKSKNNSSSGKDQRPGVTKVKAEKSNDLAPTILELSVIYQAKGAGFEQTTIVMAIKAVVHTVRTDVMLDEIGRSVQQRRFMFPTLQWATGEISFFKDLVLNLDQIKDRVASGHKDKGVRYLNRLRLMSSKNRLAAATSGERMLPTTSLVLTTDEVAYIRDSYSVNLNSTKEAEKFFELFGLMNFIIIDETTDAMYIFDEVRGQFDVSSIPKEAKENKQQGEVIKALVTAMGAK